jgi:hypothetical protein
MREREGCWSGIFYFFFTSHMPPTIKICVGKKKKFLNFLG